MHDHISKPDSRHLGGDTFLFVLPFSASWAAVTLTLKLSVDRTLMDGTLYKLPITMHTIF